MSDVEMPGEVVLQLLQRGGRHLAALVPHRAELELDHGVHSFVPAQSAVVDLKLGRLATKIITVD